MKHQLTPGDVVMFVSYLDKIYSPVDNLTSLANTLSNCSIGDQSIALAQHRG